MCLSISVYLYAHLSLYPSICIERDLSLSLTCSVCIPVDLDRFLSKDALSLSDHALCLSFCFPGFCRLTPHPRSPGTWTVHFEGADNDNHFSAADNTEMVSHKF